MDGSIADTRNRRQRIDDAKAAHERCAITLASEKAKAMSLASDLANQSERVDASVKALDDSEQVLRNAYAFQDPPAAEAPRNGRLNDVDFMRDVARRIDGKSPAEVVELLDEEIWGRLEGVQRWHHTGPLGEQAAAILALRMQAGPKPEANGHDLPEMDEAERVEAER